MKEWEDKQHRKGKNQVAICQNIWLAFFPVYARIIFPLDRTRFSSSVSEPKTKEE
jgi:hypothetical protein